MPRKAYIADLKALAQDSSIPGVSRVRPGIDDDEFKFGLAFDDGQNVDISALVLPSVSDYPSEHSYQFFVADDNAPAKVASALENLPNMWGKNLRQVLHLVSRALLRDADGDIEMVDSQRDEEAHSDEDVEERFEDFDLGSSVIPTKPSEPSHASSVQITEEYGTRVRADLRFAKGAGFKIGYYGGILGGAPSYVCVSCRISKLGISEEAMEAWHVKGNEYLILVLYYPNGYRDLDTLNDFDMTTARRSVVFRIGISHTYKPAYEELLKIFQETPLAEMHENALDKRSEEDKKGWRSSFISRPLDEMLNERLVAILKYRYLGMSWAGAENYFNDIQGQFLDRSNSKLPDGKYMEPDKDNTAFFQPILTSDHISDLPGSTGHSMPLLAMQFLLRHFVRCTEFCLVCHCKLQDDMEALKPYVCDKPLCLYQYITLGFGPSIEHEILTQPYVVDLLISFCYSGARYGKLNSFPTGLALQVPDIRSLLDLELSRGTYLPQLGPKILRRETPNTTTPTRGTPVRYDIQKSQISIGKDQDIKIRTGDWVVLEDKTNSTRLRHARVNDIFGSTAKLSEPISPPTSPDVKVSEGDAAQFDEVYVHPYHWQFDDLNDERKRTVVTNLLAVLPRVSEMKQFLTRNKLATLSSWTDRISPAGLGILRWIVASNRACILQVDKSPDLPADRGTNRLEGMGAWMQFRFAMGAPDKERRFMDSVKATSQRLRLKHPTLFAFHGSPMYNWHSIIREGLHYNFVANGRASGDGVYHSLHYSTSYSYSGAHGAALGEYWPQSEMRVATAMALNEIVNAPSEYQSQAPRLVVQHLDWIQTRYLFVRCMDAGSVSSIDNAARLAQLAAAAHPQTSSISASFEQDPAMTPNGETGKIIIPIEAMPKSRRPEIAVAKTTKNKSKKIKVSLTAEEDGDVESVATDHEDMDVFEEYSRDSHPRVGKKDSKHESGHAIGGEAAGSESKENSSLFSSLKTALSGKRSKAEMESAKVTQLTDFVPGALDRSSLPMLPPPVKANPGASAQLQKRWTAVLNSQSKNPLHELGWYIDPEHFENLYQWIIELHSFDENLPLSRQMKEKKITSIVLEMRFQDSFPFSPPFVRIIKPRFLAFASGGGGHVTAGGSLCMELLTNDGWSAVSDIESVLLQIRMAISSTDPRPAQLEVGPVREYGVYEAVESYARACAMHGWTVPPGFREAVLAMG